MPKIASSPVSQDLPSTHSFDFYYSRFKRARSADTLQIMYEGAIAKAINDLGTQGSFQAQIQIERALDRRQQEFDTLAGTQIKANHAIKHCQLAPQEYDPASEMRRLLAELPPSY